MKHRPLSSSFGASFNSLVSGRKNKNWSATLGRSMTSTVWSSIRTFLRVDEHNETTAGDNNNN